MLIWEYVKLFFAGLPSAVKVSAVNPPHLPLLTLARELHLNDFARFRPCRSRTWGKPRLHSSCLGFISVFLR